ncbi:hypothetical protein ACJW30_10G065900 [Castanea mollissima]
MMDNSCQNKGTMNDCTPKVGMEFDTLEVAWMFWKNYGKQMGFSVQKHYANISKMYGEITLGRFLCSKEGIRKPDKRHHLTIRLGVSLVRDTGKYKVYDFVFEHNHVLHLAITTFMMLSKRKMSDVQAFAIDLVYASGIKPKEMHDLMSREAGGRANLGYIGIDQNNYFRTRQQRSLIYGEAGSLLRYFQQQLVHNPLFHYVVYFDTTFGTNKEFRPLAMFIGFNHHREMTVESFKWLLRVFKMHMVNYTIKDLSWLNGIYKLKEKWANYYMKRVVTLGMQSTQLSESLNEDLKDYLKLDLNTDDFFEHFEVVGQKQDKELEAEYNARGKLPPLCLKNSPLLKQASQVYTPTIFKVFQNEYDYASAAIIKDRNFSQPVHEYTIMLLEKVFNMLDIKIILDAYNLKRWTREAKNGYVIDSIGKDVHGDVNLKVTQWYRRLCPRLVRLASQAAEIEEAYALVESVTKELEKQVEDIAMKFSSVSLDNSKDQMPLSGSEIVDHGEPVKNLVENVKGLKKKEGRKGQKICKSWVEQQSRRKKKNFNERYY